jgi:hypothetical protein
MVGTVDPLESVHPNCDSVRLRSHGLGTHERLLGIGQ